MKRDQSWLDTNDFLYAVSASRGYDPSADLNRITAPVMFVNSADDFINPPELGIAEREIKKDLHGAVGATILSTEGSGNTLILHVQHSLGHRIGRHTQLQSGSRDYDAGGTRLICDRKLPHTPERRNGAIRGCYR